MGEYKDKKGVTRVGNFLRTLKGVAPDVLDFAADITGLSQLKLLSDAIEGTDTITPKDKDIALALLEMDKQEAIEITKRWESDNLTDSFLSKNVRPMSLIFLTFIITLLMFTDSIENWNFDVKEDYIDLMKALLITVYFAYFGGRSYEKYTKIKQ
tara:strand:- start:5266 stop:5730 length:465 start_codon:yes stop_codon:yes gene_type:complete